MICRNRMNVIATSFDMAGESELFMRMLEQLNLAASSDAPVLLQGETGTGKDLAANFIHLHSSRS